MEHINALVGVELQRQKSARESPPPSPQGSNGKKPKCPICKGSGFLTDDVAIYHPNFERIYPCPHPFHNAERLARLVALSGLCEEDRGLCLDDFTVSDQLTGEVMATAKQFLAEPCSLFYLHGGPGNGKTLLLKALVNEFNQKGIMAMYVRFFDLLQWVRRSFDNKDNEGDYVARFNRIKAMPVLAIDELDKARMTEFADEFRFAFFDERYEAGLRGRCHTVIASNDPPDTLPGYLESRIMDGRCIVVHNQADDVRPYLTKGD